jgi:intracellular septation protein
MVVSTLQIIWQWWRHRHVPIMQWVTLALIIILGGATLLLHNPMFIKWKPTIVYWAFALGFFISNLIGKKPLLARLLGAEIRLDPVTWSRLNTAWIIFFVLMGIVNLIVVYNFSTNVWVYFKLFGTLTATFLFIVIQALYISKHVQEPEQKDKEEGKK